VSAGYPAAPETGVKFRSHSADCRRATSVVVIATARGVGEQIFGKAGWEDEQSDIDIGYAWAHTSLPNNFASDPNLDQVVSRTFEVGARGSMGEDLLNWSIDTFRTNNSNDIQFVATTTSEGYFANVGTTRRQGGDLALGGKLTPDLTWHFVSAS
jgi:hypothetical protein